MIAEKVISGGIWKSSGKTPEATISARLYSDIKKKGEASAFVKLSPQTFALRDSSMEAINSGSIPTPAKEAPKAPSVNAGFSFIDCAQKVLEAFGGKKADALQGNHREGIGKRMVGDERKNAGSIHVRPGDHRDQAPAKTR
jgi:hypothetical protein